VDIRPTSETQGSNLGRNLFNHKHSGLVPKLISRAFLRGDREESREFLFHILAAALWAGDGVPIVLCKCQNLLKQIVAILHWYL
jgi:hypothetical protein